MKKLLAVSLLSACLISPAAAQETFHYRMFQKKSGETLEVSRASFDHSGEGMIRLTFEKGATDASYTQKEEYIFSADDYETVSWRVEIPQESTDYTGKRTGNTIRLEGTFKGQALTRELKIDADPFYAFPKFELLPLARSASRQSLTFWAMRQDTLEAFKMTAQYRGEETINVGGKDIKAWKIFWGPSLPIARHLFKRTYYYRQPDGIFLRQEYPDGRVRELVTEP